MRTIHPALAGNKCKCGACPEKFWSVGAFDAHRRGDGDSRRCLTVDEMRALGMTQRRDGFWQTGRRSGFRNADSYLRVPQTSGDRVGPIPTPRVGVSA